MERILNISENYDEIYRKLDQALGKEYQLSIRLQGLRGNRVTRRIARTANNELIMMGMNKRKRGCYLKDGLLGYLAVYIPDPSDPAEEWRKGWEKALGYLNKSGLWKDVREEIVIALDIGYESMTQAYAISGNYDISENERIQAIKALDPRLIGTREDGSEYFHSEIIWQMGKPAKLGSMWFGKYWHKQRKHEIAEALKNHTKLEIDERAGYDASFYYNPERNTASYSEEYRGMGNGHYYLALDGVHTLFYEDD